GGHLPLPTHQTRLSTPDSVTPFRHTQQPMGGHRLVGTLDADTLDFTESRCALNESRCRAAEDPTTRRGHRFHPLRHTAFLTPTGVSERPRADFTGDHLTGVQAHPQPQVDTVAVFDLSDQPGGLLLDT